MIFNLKLINAALLSALLINIAYAKQAENYQPFLPGLPDQANMIPPSKVVAPKAKKYILPATPMTSQWGVFDNAQPPVLSINSGDTVVIETVAAAANQVVPGTTIEQVIQMNTAVEGRGPHTLTGPIYVQGAEP